MNNHFERVLSCLVCFLFSAVLASDAEAVRLPGLDYHPEGDAIVIANGTRWDNRPLYGHERFAILRSGEQPGVTGPMGRLYVAIARGGTRLTLHQFGQRIARYRAGRMEWELRDDRLPGTVVRLVITTLASADGCTARLVVEGAKPGDLAGWALVPPGADKGSQFQVRTAANGFNLDRVPAAKLARFGRVDYDYKRDGFVLPKDPPPQVRLGADCRAIVAGWKLRPGVKLDSVTLETLSPEVVIGLMGVSIMNPVK